jgi:predicted nucleotidyltransferase
MYTAPDLNTITKIVCSVFNDIQILILFGSYAKGISNDKSDIDIAIIVDKKPERKEKLQILNTLLLETARMGYEVDFIIKSAKEYKKEKTIVATLSHTLFKEGKVLWKKEQKMK